MKSMTLKRRVSKVWWATLGAALISAAAAIIVCVINNNSNHKKVIAEIDKQNALHAHRIEQLEKKMDKHNTGHIIKVNIISETHAYTPDMRC